MSPLLAWSSCRNEGGYYTLSVTRNFAGRYQVEENTGIGIPDP